jgi:hypothetical protein
VDENPPLYPGWKIWEAFHGCLENKIGLVCWWDITPLLDDEEVEDDIDEEAVVEQVLCLDEDDEKWKSSGALEDVVGLKELEMDETELMCGWLLRLPPKLLLLAWKLLFTGQALTLQGVLWPVLLLLLLDVDEILLYEDDRWCDTGFAGRGKVGPPCCIWDGFITDNIFVFYAL